MKIFICFSNNRGIGGLLAGKIYNTLVSYLSSEDVYFSSAENRPYGNNYRDEELLALKKSDYIIIVLTNELIDGLNSDSETLFEIKTALESPSLKIIPVAVADFEWNKKRVDKIVSYLNEEKAQYLSKLDYISFFGEREYNKVTAPEILKFLGIKPVPEVFRSLVEVKSQIVNTQNERLFWDDNNSVIANELLYFQQNLYVEPQKRINGELCSESILGKMRNSLINNNSMTWFILGEIGSGKTTIMRKLYLSISKETAENIVPIYIRSRELDSLQFEKEKLLKKHLMNLGLYFPGTTVNKILDCTKLCFYIDALDELACCDYNSITTALKQRSDNCIYIFSCRKNFFQHIQVNSVNCLVELIGFSNVQKKEIIDKYFEIENRISKNVQEKVKKVVLNNEIFNNVLFIAIWLILLKSQPSISISFPINKYDMMERIMKGIFNRENNKSLNRISLEVFFKNLYKVATLLLRNKGSYEKVQINELQYELLKKGGDELNLDLIKGFLMIDPITSECSFAHEQFYEFLIAKLFIELLLQQKEEFIDLISSSFSIETNQLITERFRQSQKEEFLAKLKRAYMEIPSYNTRAKLHILNHMHRTELYPEIKEFVVERLRNKQEKDMDDVNRILLLHSLVVSGDEEDEEFFYQELMKDTSFAQLNACITLSYYYESNNGDCFPKYDDGSLSWYPVFIGYQNHIKKRYMVPHYYKVLRINMFTAKTYICTRRQVDQDVSDYYLSIDDELKNDATLFGKKIYQEYIELCSIINKYKEI